MITSLASLIAISVVLISTNLLMILLVLLLSVLLVGSRFQVQKRKRPVIIGILLGIVVAIAGFLFM